MAAIEWGGGALSSDKCPLEGDWVIGQVDKDHLLDVCRPSRLVFVGREKGPLVSCCTGAESDLSLNSSKAQTKEQRSLFYSKFSRDYHH